VALVEKYIRFPFQGIAETAGRGLWLADILDTSGVVGADLWLRHQCDWDESRFAPA
jgi:hypothetical protein